MPKINYFSVGSPQLVHLLDPIHVGCMRLVHVVCTLCTLSLVAALTKLLHTTSHCTWVVKCSAWCMLSLNRRSKCMLITRSRSHRLNLKLFLNGKQLERVKHFKYLGLWISDDLSWSYPTTLKQFVPRPGACLASSIVFSHPIVMPTLFCLYIRHTFFPSLTMPL